MASPGVLALFASQRKNPILVRESLCVHVGLLNCVKWHTSYLKYSTCNDPKVNVMIICSAFSCVAVVIVISYASLTLTYGEDDEEVFHHHYLPEVVNPCHPPPTYNKHTSTLIIIIIMTKRQGEMNTNIYRTSSLMTLTLSPNPHPVLS